MYYRVTNLSFDVSRRDEFIAHADTLRDEMKSINGLESVRMCEVGEGELVGMARYDSEKSATAAQPQVQSILGQLADFMTGPPDSRVGSVIWDM